jgi:hypothetical protein
MAEAIETPAVGPNDSSALPTPRWLNTLVATVAEVVLLIATIGIIVAMWLPAYLTSRQPPDLGDHREEMMGMFPRGR